MCRLDCYIYIYIYIYPLQGLTNDLKDKYSYTWNHLITNSDSANSYASPVLGRIPLHVQAADNTTTMTWESAIFFGVTDTTTYGTDNSRILGYYTNYSKWGTDLYKWQYPPKASTGSRPEHQD